MVANPKHVEWLLEGVAKWNDRLKDQRQGGASLFTPELANVDVRQRFLDAGQYDGYGLLSLSEVDFAGAVLAGTKLHSADLSKAKLSNTNLKGASFACTNLNGADFYNADLAGADLSGASSLAGAVFAHAECLQEHERLRKHPLRATLYPDNDSPTPRWNDERRITSIRDFLKEIAEITEHHGEDGAALYFRGEPKCGWPLEPSITREARHRSNEANMLRDLMSRRPEEFSQMSSSLEQWVLARHHGLPTRLLDITRNPLVALFNACEYDQRYEKKAGRLYVFAVRRELIKPFNSDTVSIIANLAKLQTCEQKVLLCDEGGGYNNYEIAKLRLYQGIKVEKPYFEERIDIRDFYKVFVVEPKQSPDRVRAQSGAFLASAFHERFEREEILGHNDRIPIYAEYRMKISSGDKDDIREELNNLNITEETLMPGLDSSAKVVADRYRKV